MLVLYFIMLKSNYHQSLRFPLMRSVALRLVGLGTAITTRRSLFSFPTRRMFTEADDREQHRMSMASYSREKVDADACPQRSNYLTVLRMLDRAVRRHNRLGRPLVCIPVRGERVSVLDEPREFYQELLVHKHTITHLYVCVLSFHLHIHDDTHTYLCMYV